MTDYDCSSVITRGSFADFLDRYADGKVGSIEWQHFIVRHYQDGFLEEVRCCVVRLAINQLPIHGDTAAARDILRSWAFLLRSSTNASSESKPSVVTIDMTPSEAVVFDSFLRRYSDSDKLMIENSAEQRCLWNLECLLEKHQDRPKWPTIREAIDELSPEE